MSTHKPMVDEPLAFIKPKSSGSLIDRDESILSFNVRVLDWARRVDVPLLERLRYLCIVSSNMDEYFEVRASLHLTAFKNTDRKGAFSQASYERVMHHAHQLVNEQYRVYNEDLIPELEKNNIRIVSHGERNQAQKNWVENYFKQEVKLLLIPVSLDPAHPFPQVANKSLNFIVRVGGKDAFGRSNEIAIVKVPRVLPRFIKLPQKISQNQTMVVSLSSIIRSHLKDLFPDRDVLQFSQFRVTRNSDLSVDEEDVKNLRTALRRGLENRQFGNAVRLEVSSGCSDFLADFLNNQFELPEQALFRVHGPVNLVRLNQVIDLAARPELLFKPYQATYPRQLTAGISLFSQIKEKDILFHQPFESFGAVLDLLREAVNDPKVLAIKQTVYRTGTDSELMDLLREAVRLGKEVTAVVELKARFDEEANINWAEQLESIGAQVVYGVVGLKTHAKMLLITRREGKILRRYGHLSTGNYNARTARLYTDLSFLTCDAAITSDMEDVFLHLASQNKLNQLNQLIVAPFHLHSKMMEFIEDVAQAVQAGKKGRIVLKMNALTDDRLAQCLIDASKKGVQIDLIIRGACILPAGISGYTDNIKVRSVIGRFLEHSRVFYFRIDEDVKLYLSSADWMNRNMLRRIELAWPITNPELQQKIIDECLVAYLSDTADAWQLHDDLVYHPVDADAHRKPLSAQKALMKRYSATRR